jgi:hypothetical protein
MNWNLKYLKYKQKYLELKNYPNLIGGADSKSDILYSNINEPFDEKSIIIIPKNTLLFRSVLDSTTDFTGIKLNDKYCLPSSYNVFFYFSPFIIDGLPHWFKDYQTINVYITTHDIKILSLIKNSIYNRGSRITNTILTKCNLVKTSCLEGREYDPCFTDIFMDKYPDVMGWIAISKGDGIKLKKEMSNGYVSDRKIRKYIHLTHDNRKVWGPPEVALYPLKNRIRNDKIIDNNKSKEWIEKEEFNYKFLCTLDRKKETLIKFMEKYSIFDPQTLYYSLTNSLSDSPTDSTEINLSELYI